MNKLTIFTLFFIISFGCKTEVDKKKEEVHTTDNIEEVNPPKKEEEPFNLEEHLKNYQNLKKEILNEQSKIKNRNDIEQEDKYKLAADYISKTLLDSIFKYWLGTTWDFNGYTEKPRDGEVACGYFVSTTLRDVGIKLNRFKIAQKGASDIIHALCDNNTIVKLSSFEKLTEYLKNIKNEEILIVGLDYHVGFIYKKNDLAYFAHSNYINREGVVIELIQESVALKNTNIYVTGSLTKNKKMIRRWVN